MQTGPKLVADLQRAGIWPIRASTSYKVCDQYRVMEFGFEPTATRFEQVRAISISTFKIVALPLAPMLSLTHCLFFSSSPSAGAVYGLLDKEANKHFASCCTWQAVQPTRHVSQASRLVATAVLREKRKTTVKTVRAVLFLRHGRDRRASVIAARMFCRRKKIP